ncbi:MAG: antitoxin Xre/MbcA/ParS toxin-binding domain-containing protein [Opitutaceae bacterium]
MTTLESVATDAVQAEQQIVAGIDWAEAEHLAELLDLPISRLAELLQVAPATMARRKTQRRFTIEESERIVRFARLWFLACQAVGGPPGARSWLKRPQHGLSGRVPLEVARLEVGARTVEALLQRINYGVLA